VKYRTLGILPFAMAAALAAASLALGDRMGGALAVANETGKLLSLAGALAAALGFERGDYLRRAWLTYGGCYLLLLANDTLGATAADLHVVRGLLVAMGNVCSVAGTWMLASAWNVAGLGDEGEGVTRRRAMFAGAALLSLAITGVPLWRDVRDCIGGQHEALVSIASDLGDTFTLALVAPVMQTALAMRGGLLRWPWGYLTASGVAWIVYDMTSSLISQGHVGSGLPLAASESLRVLANGYVFAAGVSQRMAVAPDSLLASEPAA
jgi:hypothetical protein